MEASRPVWTATYRLQLHAGFGFDDVAAIAPYLAEALGVSHVYLSPILQAEPGSAHGYNGTDPTRISDDLGGPEAYDRMTEALRRHGIGQLLDIVPNHTAASARNPWWWDVLRHGKASRYASYFDLRWQDGDPPFIRLPVLGADLDTVLANGELTLEAAADGPVLRYYESRFPIAPETAPPDHELEVVNREPDAIAALLCRQHYRLLNWRQAATAIDYRRFFDINGLVAMRVEEEAVFEAMHGLVLRLVGEGRVQGLRIDHIDGLRDPDAYLERLRGHAPEARILAEKILEQGERLPDHWPAEGTTGYDFLATANGLFVDPGAEDGLSRLYRYLTGITDDYEAVLAEKKRFAVRRLFGGDLAHVAGLFRRTQAGARWALDDLEAALTELIVALPVYRTYAQPGRETPGPDDRRLIETAVQAAAQRLPGAPAGLFDDLRAMLLLERRGEAESDFVLSLQQLSGPAMAKGAEDTAFYVYNRLVSLNEVGGSPGRFGTRVREFHEACVANARRWPLTMLTTATHDTKRGEDTRLRIDAISELPDAWSATVRAWMGAHEAYCVYGWPDANARYLLYQVLAGAWPIEEARLQEYMLKATREAKTYTSWLEPNEAYEAATRSYVSRLFADPAFCEQCVALAARLQAIARVSSLSQTLLKLTCPGVPDVYQGSELWQLCLVDPDNRRPVDYGERQRLLREAAGLSASEVLARMEEGLPKLWLIWKTLQLRRRLPDVFDADYAPLHASAPHEDCAVAFVRGGRLITAVPRLVERLSATWQAAMLSLPPGAWRNVFTGAVIDGGETSLAALWRDFPVALLLKEPGA